jgi:hypothetical protein
MALTIAYEGIGVVANAGGATYPNDGVSGASWSNTGGGTTAAYNPDAFVEGTESVGLKYANKDGLAYVTLASTYSFATSGNAENQFIYIWLNIQSNGQFDTIGATPPGLSIIAGTNATNFRRWTVAGDSNDNGWGSGWKCFVIDPTTAGESDQGTYSTSTINIIGLDINSDTSVRADSIFIDEITIASGLRVTGTTTANDAWGEIKTWCVDTPGTRRFGFLDVREGIYYVKGKLYVGNGTATTSFEDQGKIVKFETSEYYNGTSWVTAVPTDAYGIVLADGTGTTTFEDGIIVGTDNGRSGSTYIGNENQSVSFDASGLTNASSDVNLYGTTFTQFTGGIIGEADANHAYLGVTFQGSAQFVPAGAPVIRNCTFAETSDADAALLWNGSIDIENCKFIANTTGAAIEVVETSTQDFDALTFSGNTNDVLLNNGTPGTNINISKSNGSNPTTYENAAGNTATVTFVGAAVTIEVKATLPDGSVVQDARVRVSASDGTGPFPFNETVTISNTGTTASVTHTGHGMANGDKVMIKGASLAENNGIFAISNVATNSYDYTMGSTPGSSPTGTIKSTFVAVEGLTNASGIVTTSRVYASAQPVTGYARKATSSPYYKPGPINGTISATTGFSFTAVLTPDGTD